MKRLVITLNMIIMAFLANAQSCPDSNHPHAIDLGLPSGTKWACCNVGAISRDGDGLLRCDKSAHQNEAAGFLGTNCSEAPNKKLILFGGCDDFPYLCLQIIDNIKLILNLWLF